MRIRYNSHQQLSGVSGLMRNESKAGPVLTPSKKNGKSPTRRTAVAMLASGAAFAPALVSRALAAETLSVRLDWSPHAMHCPFHLATERGWFRDAGLDVTIEDGNGSTTTVQIVGGGRFDIGHAALAPMAIGCGSGLPIISIAGFLRKGDMGILIDRKFNAKTPKDLIGKKIDYTAGSLEGPFVEPFFTMNGISLNKIDLLNVDASAKLSSYVAHAVDGIITSVPTYYVLLEDKRPVDYILFADHGLNLPGFGLISRPNTLKTKGDAIKRFASVICSTWTYIYDGHQEEAAKALLKRRPDAGFTVPNIVDTLAFNRQFFFLDTRTAPIGIQDEKDWAATLKQMEGANVIPAGTKPSDYFTNAYIDYAIGNKVVGIG
jgi:NitT/TauT family transport system substrate-binding protein